MRKFYLATIIVLAVSGLSAVLNPASAASPRSAGLVTGSASVGGVSVSYGWVSSSLLASEPTLAADLGIAPVAGRATGAMRPATSGIVCDGVVCMQVVGRSLSVSEILVSVSGNYGCIHAMYSLELSNGPYWPSYVQGWSGARVCSNLPVDGTYWYRFGPNADLLPVTLIRNGFATGGWLELPGEPQVTIYKS